MKRLIIIFILYFSICLFPYIGIKANASTEDYHSFVEIMMNEGKVLDNFTEAEYEKYYQEVRKRKFSGISTYVVNSNIDATYISNTLHSVENRGATDVTYDFDVKVETANKTTFNFSGSMQASASGTIKKVKTDVGAKVGIEYTSVDTESKTEKQSLHLVVEKNSRAIVYLTGNLSITNGVCAYYSFWVRVHEGGFEIAQIKNQYTRIEKVTIK